MANFDGKYSEYQLRKGKKCRYCKQTGHVYFLGSTVQHGNPYTPAADTEVDHHFKCDRCGKSWDEYA
ncbi:MAG: hypothetical protein AAF125_15710 [Chloroflexota bacterium]